MNKQQMQWAKQHDWFIRAVQTVQIGWDARRQLPILWLASFTVFVRGDVGEAPIISFTDYHALREWAGY